MYSASDLKSLRTQADAAHLESMITAGQQKSISQGREGSASTWGPRAAVDIVAQKARMNGLNVAIYDMHNGDRFEVVVSPTTIYDNGKQRVG